MVIKTLDPDWIRIWIGIQPKMLDPDRYQMNTDPQPCFYLNLVVFRLHRLSGGRDANELPENRGRIQLRTLRQGLPRSHAGAPTLGGKAANEFIDQHRGK